jgi:myo-inositol-1(or 4)-monophosphatase
MTELSGENLQYNCPEVTHGTLVAAGRPRHRHLLETLARSAVF